MVNLEDQFRPSGQPLTDVGIVIPTYNAARHWPELTASLALEGVHPSQVLVIDSSSKDATRELAQQSGYRVVSIPQAEFNHGGTRQFACSYFPGTEKILFCTQDVVFTGGHSIESLSQAFDDPAVGAAYGRQLPRAEANAIERHARFFNYPETSQVRTIESSAKLGIKAVFFSNSFAMYRRSALEAVGGFPDNVLLAEDSIVAARMLVAGWKVVYKGDAAVIHSHPLRLLREAARYFDTGAHHAREPWLLQTFGTANVEGKRFIASEMRYLLANAPHLIPLALLRTATKLAAYRVGAMERHLPTSLKKKFSDYPHFWEKNRRR